MTYRSVVFLLLGCPALATVLLIVAPEPRKVRPRAGVPGPPVRETASVAEESSVTVTCNEVTTRKRTRPRAGQERDPKVGRGPLEILVVDELDRPVRGAELVIVGGRAVTGVDGRGWLPAPGYNLGSPRLDRRLKTVTVRAPGFVPVHQWIGVVPTDLPDPPRCIRLTERGCRVQGRCVDARGKPVPGVRLLISPRWPRADLVLETDAAGRFETDQVRRGENVISVARGDWIAPDVRIDAPRDSIELTVHRTASLWGRFAPEQGDELPRDFTIAALEPGQWMDRWSSRWRGSDFYVRAVPGPLALVWKEQNLVLARFNLAPGEKREKVVVRVPVVGPQGACE